MKSSNPLTRILLVISLVITALPLMGSAYMEAGGSLYVDGVNGSDSNSGNSTSAPFKTIQKAVTMVSPGTTILVRGGTYNENIVVTISGSDGAPITLKPFSGEAVTINGNSNIALRNSGAVAYWVLEGLTIKSTNRYTLRLGWWGEPMTDHWTIRNNKIFGANYIMGSYHDWESNDISGSGYTGTSGDAGISDGSGSHHNTYRSNYVHDFTNVDARGIWTQGKTHDSLIEYNTVSNINTASGLGQCIDLDGAGKVEWRHAVRGNKVSNCSYVGIQLENVFDSVIENNVVSGGSAGIITINYDSKVGCLVGGENNQYGDTNGDGSCQGDPANNIIRQNVISNTSNWGWGYGGIVNWYTGGLKVWNNTISSNGAAGNGGINFQGTLSQTNNGSIVNNIITQGSGAAICANDLASIAEDNYNLVYRTNDAKPYASGGSCNTGYSLTEYQTARGKALKSLAADPRFVNASSGDFHLAPNSPAIDTGTGLNLNSDIDGLARPANVTYDMGAYEFGGTPAPVSPTPTITTTGTLTVTATPTGSVTNTPTATSTFTSTATNTPTIVQTATTTSIPTNTPPVIKSATATSVPTNAPTATKTALATSASTQTSANNLALGKPATQINTNAGAVASRAVDGNTDGNLQNNSVSNTLVNTEGWWQVDLQTVAQINSINIWNRTDCCSWRLTDVFVLVSNNPIVSTNLTEARNQAGVDSYLVAGRIGRPSSVAINRTGRYVRVQMINRDYLTLAEVEVIGRIIPPTSTPTNTPTNTPTFTPTTIPTNTSVPTNIPVNAAGNNLALGKPATQINTNAGADASRAVDGNTDGNLQNNSVSNTLVNNEGWWQVDLQAVSNIDSINIWNRTDCCSWRLTDVFVLVSDNPIVSTNLTEARSQAGVDSYLVAGRIGRPSSVAINRTGRYVRVQMINRDYLTLAEVEIFGSSVSLLSKMSALIQAILPTSTPAAVFTPTQDPTPTATFEVPVEPTSEPEILPTDVPAEIPTEVQPEAPIRNLAPGSTASQSSDFEGAAASKAIDGNTDGNMSNGSVAQTNKDLQAWWEVDLGSSYPLQSINVWSRTDFRPANVFVLVSDNPIQSKQLDAARKENGVSSYLISGEIGSPSIVEVLKTGRYVRIQLQSEDILSLAEVEIIGGPGVQLPAQPVTIPTAAPEPTLVPTDIPVIPTEIIELSPTVEVPQVPVVPTEAIAPTNVPAATEVPPIPTEVIIDPTLAQ
jgi:hypothetical protein